MGPRPVGCGWSRGVSQGRVLSPTGRVVNTHPGLAFLKEAAEFHSRLHHHGECGARGPRLRALTRLTCLWAFLWGSGG